MTRCPVPLCLAGLPDDLDLRELRGKPSGLARFTFAVILCHIRGNFARPGFDRLGRIAGVRQAKVRQATALLVRCRALERDGNGWRVRLVGDGTNKLHFFWPVPADWRKGDDQTVAVRALVAALGNNHAAVILMLYQFSRPANELGWSPMRPNLAWIGRVLCTSVDTVRRAKRAAIRRGLAVEQSDGLLVFEDPGRWPAILSPGLRLVEPCDDSDAAHDATAFKYGESSRERELVGTPRALILVVWPFDTVDATDGTHDAAHDAAHDGNPTGNDGLYSVQPSDIVREVEQRLAHGGWRLPNDPLVPEILAAAFDRWGRDPTLDWLLAGLAGPHPSHALEPIGAALGERYECPYQLIRRSPDLRT